MADNNIIGALWQSDGDYLSGNIDVEKIDKEDIVDGKLKLVVFKNTYKKKENHPDYNILKSKKKVEEKKEEKKSSLFD